MHKETKQNTFQHNLLLFFIPWTCLITILLTKTFSPSALKFLRQTYKKKQKELEVLTRLPSYIFSIQYSSTYNQLNNLLQTIASLTFAGTSMYITLTSCWAQFIACSTSDTTSWQFDLLLYQICGSHSCVFEDASHMGYDTVSFGWVSADISKDCHAFTFMVKLDCLTLTMFA